MGGALGIVLGTAMNYGVNRMNAEVEHKHETDNTLLHLAMSNPAAAQIPEIQKAIKTRFSPEIADFIAHSGQIQQQFGEQLRSATSPQAGGGGGASPPGVPALHDASVSSPDQDPLASHLNEVGGRIDRLNAILASPEAQMPENAAAAKHARDLVTELEKHRSQFQTEAFQSEQKTEDRAQRQEMHQDREADVARSQAQSAEFREMSQAQQKQNQEFQQQFKTTEQQIQKSKNDEERAQHVATLGKSIDAERDSILGNFAKKPSAAFEAQVKAHNARASMFYRKHADAGAPTLLKFTAGQEGSTLRGVAGIGKPTVDPTIEAMPPQYGTNKKTGQSGWIDADGNFYAETDEATAAK